MKVAVAGAHGQLALLLAPLLAARGDEVIGLIRNPDHAGKVTEAGATPVMCDLEQATTVEVAAAIDGVDAVVFAAGSGPGSGADRKVRMDRDGAVKLLDAAEQTGARRYVMISGAGVEDPPQGDGVFEVYMRAKADADNALQASGLEWTILRPGQLLNDTGTGLVRLGTEPFSGQVPRLDVAAVIAAVLMEPLSINHVLYLAGGTAPVSRALGHVLDRAVADGQVVGGAVEQGSSDVHE